MTKRVIPHITKAMANIVPIKEETGNLSFFANAITKTFANIFSENIITVAIIYRVVAITLPFFSRYNYRGYDESCQESSYKKYHIIPNPDK